MYGKAGVATGTEQLSVVSGLPVPNVAFSSSSRQWGATGGVGVEYLLTPNLVAGVEYDYASLSKASINTTTTGAVVGLPISVNSSNFGVSTVIGRLSYKWGGPVVAKY